MKKRMILLSIVMNVVAFTTFASTSHNTKVNLHHRTASHKQVVVHKKNQSKAHAKQHTKKAIKLKTANKPAPEPFEVNHNKLYRSYIEQGDISHVDPYTGNLRIKLPIITIPGNDGLPLQVVFNFDNALQNKLLLIMPTFKDTQVGKPYFPTLTPPLGYGWHYFTGLYGKDSSPYDDDNPMTNASPKISYYNPIFIDPAGNQHQFYSTDNKCAAWTTTSSGDDAPCGPIKFLSKDNWHASLYKVGTYEPNSNGGFDVRYYWAKGTITSPNGVHYTLDCHLATELGSCAYMPVREIVSPNGGTTLTYQYDDEKHVTSITRNDGFKVVFNYHKAAYPTNYNGEDVTDVLDSVQTSDGRVWKMGYMDFALGNAFYPYGNVFTVQSIIEPDNHVWQFTPSSDGEVFTASKGYSWHPLPPLNNIILSKIVSPMGLISTFQYQNNYKPYSPRDNYSSDFMSMYDRVAQPSVITKTLSGAGLPQAIWHYAYTPFTTSRLPNGQVYYRYGKTTTIMGPDSIVTDTFNNTENAIWLDINDTDTAPLATPMTGVLLNRTVSDLSGHVLQTTQYQWGKRLINVPYIPYLLKPVTSSPESRSDYNTVDEPYTNGMYFPKLLSKTITRGGVNYTTTYSNYDQYGYPANEVLSSPQGTKKEAFTYYKNPTKWVFKTQDVTTTDAANTPVNSIKRTFDDNGNMTSEDVNGVATTYKYDSAGDLISKADALNNTTTYADYVAGLPQTITDAMGNVTHYAVASNGTITSKTTPLGFKTSYTYGPLYRLTGITPPLHAPTTLSWTDNAKGTALSMIRRDPKTNKENAKLIQFNSLGKIISTVNTDDVNSNAVYKRYDALDRLVYQSFPTTFGNTTAPGTTFTYDVLNRLTSSTQAGQYTTLYAYNTGSTHNDISITDANGHETDNVYRSFGDPDVKQLMQVNQPDGITTTIARALMGQITSITQGAFTRTYAYNGNHYLISEINPEIGITTYGRDILGNMTSKQVGSEAKTSYDYDKLNRLVNTIYADNQVSHRIARTYDKDGRLTSIIGGNIDSKGNFTASNSWTYVYDANNNLLSQTFSPGTSAHYALTYTYDNFDHLKTLQYPDGSTVGYTVNPLGRVTAILPFITNATYFPDNRLKSFTDNNGVVTTYTENTRGMPNSVVAEKGATKYVDKQYVYDGVGNVMSINDALNSANDQSFDYDGVNRLTTANGAWGKGAITYDINSNITNKMLNGQTATYHYDPKTDLLMSITGANAQSFTYANGDVTQLTGLTLQYNNLQQVTSISGTGKTGKAVNDTYHYDGNGNRYVTTSPNDAVIELHNRKSQLLYKVNPSTQLQDMYIRLGGHTVVHLQKTGANIVPIYLHNNLLGSALAATTAQGTTKWTEQYKPYGSEMKTNAGRSNPHMGYTGKEHNTETGLSYYGARFYDPEIGRFISPDPASVNAAKPITFNRYAYANDNPYRYTDPLGMKSVDHGHGNDSDHGSNDKHDNANIDASKAASGLEASGTIGMIMGWIEDGPVGDVLDDAIGSTSITAGKAIAKDAADSVAEARATGKLSASSRAGLSKSASEMDPADSGGQLTKAGRAAQKHGSRPDSAFSKTSGNPASINEQGQNTVNNILNHPDSTVSVRGDGGVNIHAPDGRGVAFNADGSMRGFLEP